MQFTVMLIMDILLGLMLAALGNAIARHYREGQTKWVCGALGFFLGALLTGGLMVMAGHPGLYRIFDLFWPLPIASMLLAVSMTTGFWSGLGKWLNDATYYSPDTGIYRNQNYYSNRDPYYEDRRSRQREQERERRYWGE
jgi:hypothetical protein